MEATQLLEGALDESLPYYSAEDDENNFPKKLIGVMIIEENKEYNVFQGDTISIGRDPENLTFSCVAWLVVGTRRWL